MADERKRSGIVLLNGIGFCLCVYIAYYFLGGATAHKDYGTNRYYSSQAIARLFIPAAWIEAIVAETCETLWSGEENAGTTVYEAYPIGMSSLE